MTLTLRRPPPWAVDAACQGMVTPDLDPWLPDDDLPAEVRARLLGLALDVCNGSGDRPACRVRDHCLEEALATGEAWSVRGGTTPAERRRLAAERGFPRPSPAGASQHGTRGRYVEGCHDGPDGRACGPCRRANATYKAGWLARRSPVTPRGLIAVVHVLETPAGTGRRRAFPGQLYIPIGATA